jgi:hypothetical protein
MSVFYKIIDIMIEDYQLRDVLNEYDPTSTSNLGSKLSLFTITLEIGIICGIPICTDRMC